MTYGICTYYTYAHSHVSYLLICRYYSYREELLYIFHKKEAST